MDNTFYENLMQQITAAIVKGKRHIVYWGFNENCVKILVALDNQGILKSYTSGVVDSDPQRQGNNILGYTVIAPKEIINIDIDVLVICVDRGKEEVLTEFAKFDKRLPEIIIEGISHFAFNDPVFDEIFSSCLIKSYATGYENSLIHIYQSIKYLASAQIKGNIVEFGMFKGGTTQFIGKTLNYFGINDCRIFGFDIFERFPPRGSVFDLYTNPDCEFRDFKAVENFCKMYGIEVIKGDICKTYKAIEGIPLMLSFFDTDNYSPTKVALQMCFEQTVTGGVLAFDHFISERRFIYTVGERIAAKEVLMDKKVFNLHGTGIFIKL